MRRDILSEAVKLNMEHRRRKWWHRVVSTMGAVVVFVTTYALILPAITMEQETVCGVQEHSHSSACYYTPVLNMGRDYRCALVLHNHEENCFAEDGTPVCAYADFVVHTHDSNCFDAQGKLVCTLEEVQEHTHGEACYETEVTYLCGLAEGDGGHAHGDECWSDPSVICGLEESPGHSHSDSCYGQPPLICGLEEQVVTESELTENTGELSVTETTAEAHYHTDACYGSPELKCGLDEAEPHAHSTECYSEKQFVCELEEQCGHVHDETCGTQTNRKLICEKPELVLHTHTDACFDETGALICGICQIESHQHTDACFADHIHLETCYQTGETETILVCPLHVHDEQCYDAEGQQICHLPILICDMQEHTHQESCYPEVDDGLVEVQFLIPEDYAELIQSEVTFPAVYTLEEGSTLADMSGLPIVEIVNPEGEERQFLPDYHWVTAEGFPVDAAAPITEDVTLTLQLYPADKPEAAKLATVAFVIGEETLLSREVNVGTVASELITTELLEQLDQRNEVQHRFEGWSYTDADGQYRLLENGVTVIEADTVYRAVFREYVAVTLHDVDPNGNLYPGSPLQQYIPAGSSLAQQEGLLLSDGTDIRSCLWFTFTGEPFLLNTAVTQAIDLYTYSYSLLLDMHPRQIPDTPEEPATEAENEPEPVMAAPWLMRAAFAAETDVVSADQSETTSAGNVSIVKRRGEELTESDFVVDGVNYTDYLWEDEEGNNVNADDLVGTSLTSNYALVRAANAEYEIRYDINISGTPFGATPTVGGVSNLTDTYNTANGSYTIRVPNPTQYMVTSGSKRTLYQFTGWSVRGHNYTIKAGETVDAAWVEDNQYLLNDYVSLRAQWTSVATKETVHFFVNVNCQVTDIEGNTNIPSSGDFTPSVYSTTMSITGTNMKNYWQGAINKDTSSSQYIVLRADSASQTESIDAKIRSLITGYDTTNVKYNNKSVWKSNYSGTKIFQANDFPSDENVLSVVRSMVQDGTVIRMNNVPIAAEDLTSDNFTVRWNVCKYDSGDGWHIDGILVGKQANINVKKTFLGDDVAIVAVKNGNYSITLDNTTNSSAQNLILTLSPEAEEKRNGYYGYDAYDPNTDTYTWSVPLQQNCTYTVFENNYKSADDAVQTAAVYTISNSPDAFSGWETYPENGITNVKAYSYANDVSAEGYQTVTIRNSYVKSDTLTINKIDMDSGNGLSGISYRLADSAGSPLVLYQKPGVSYYSMKQEDMDNGFVQISDSVITTDHNGSIFLKLDSGIFTLEEAFPTGYGGVSKITVTVGVDSTGSVVFDQISSSDSTVEVDGTLVDKNTATLTIRNVSFSTSVTAQKVWNNLSDSKPVTVSLYRNGIDMGVTYQAILNAGNNWTYTWNKLPLYVDGGVAKYTLREIRIGDTNYDPSADTDGYAGYIVAYDELVYKKNGTQVPGPVWTDDNGVTQYADNAHLTVRNEVYRGQMMFLKVDGEGNPLPGAVFRLYADETRTKLVAEATSDAYGRVVFENLMPNTYYVMKEAETPVGYIGGDSLYKIRLTPQGSTTLEDSSSGEVLTAVVNYQDTATVEVEKVSTFGTHLPDARFQLDKLDGQNWVSENTGQTDESGKLVLGELKSGTYRLTETRAPDGFMPLPASITFTLENGKLRIDNPHELWSATTDEETGNTVIKVINESGYVLPKTGGSTVVPYYTAGFALMLAALVLLLRRRKGAAPF